MRPGREIDARIAKEVFGHEVWAQNKILFENAARGDRPLRNYSKEVEWAFEVARQMKMAFFPVAGGQWFAFVGPANIEGWESPTSMLEFLSLGNFNECGAAVGENIATVICECALKATEKRNAVPIEAGVDVVAGGIAAEGDAEADPHAQIKEQARSEAAQSVAQLSGMLEQMANTLTGAMSQHEALRLIPRTTTTAQAKATQQDEESDLH